MPLVLCIKVISAETWSFFQLPLPLPLPFPLMFSCSVRSQNAMQHRLGSRAQRSVGRWGGGRAERRKSSSPLRRHDSNPTAPYSKHCTRLSSASRPASKSTWSPSMSAPHTHTHTPTHPRPKSTTQDHRVCVYHNMQAQEAGTRANQCMLPVEGSYVSCTSPIQPILLAAGVVAFPKDPHHHHPACIYQDTKIRTCLLISQCIIEVCRTS